MKKYIRNILIFLLLGSILNVAVALYGFLEISGGPYSTGWWYMDGPNWNAGDIALEYYDESWLPVGTEIKKKVQQYAELKSAPDFLTSPQRYEVKLLVYHGLCWRAYEFMGSYTIGDLSMPWHVDGLWRGGLVEFLGWPLPVYHRIRDVQVDYDEDRSTLSFSGHCNWVGIVSNTLFYAVLLWLPYQGFVSLRRRRRIQRGQCGQCGYMVAPNLGVPGASPNCPECGTPITRKSIQLSAISQDDARRNS